MALDRRRRTPSKHRRTNEDVEDELLHAMIFVFCKSWYDMLVYAMHRYGILAHAVAVTHECARARASGVI